MNESSTDSSTVAGGELAPPSRLGASLIGPSESWQALLSIIPRGRGNPKNRSESPLELITQRLAVQCGGDLFSVVIVFSESQQAVRADGRHADDGNGPQGRQPPRDHAAPSRSPNVRLVERLRTKPDATPPTSAPVAPSAAGTAASPPAPATITPPVPTSTLTASAAAQSNP